MTSEPPPPTLRLTVDTDALAENWQALNTMSGAARAGAAVKADAYGLGIDICVPALVDAGCRNFFVAHWSEVEAVARYVAPAQISVLHGPLTGEDCAYAKSVGAKPTINSLHQAKLWLDAGGGPCDAMIDTGINRLGLSPNEVAEPLVAQLEVDLLMSHLASADEDSALNGVQLARFADATNAVRYKYLSLANSAGIALGANYHFDITRPGLALYGGVPRPEMAPDLRQVAHLQAAIIQTRQLSAGDSVGYNATFTASQTMRVGVISLGYADGYLRCWSGIGKVTYKGQSLPVLGRVSMDMIVVDLTAAEALHEGDWVDIPWHLLDAADQSGMSQYELLTGLGPRLRATR